MSARRHRIVHRTTLGYAGEVLSSHNELRMTPVSEPGQFTLEARVRVRPHTWSNVYTDHWGSSVMAVETQIPHQTLEIEATATVERSELPVEATDIGWGALADEGTCDRLSELLAQTARTTPSDELVALAETLRDEPTPRAAAMALSQRVNEHMTYTKGATQVSDTGADAWAKAKGVCQDYAHVTIGALRAIGIPARYVSGYVGPEAELERGQSAPGASHAWIEIWDGAWLPLDPTNLRPVGLDHVVVGRGRDYDDVSPFRGMYAGPEVGSLDVEITFTRMS